jgi:hypothetical protein
MWPERQPLPILLSTTCTPQLIVSAATCATNIRCCVHMLTSLPPHTPLTPRPTHESQVAPQQYMPGVYLQN